MEWRNITLILLTGIAGVLSGILWLIPNGLMGGALGMSLSAGTIWLASVQTRQNGDLNSRQVLKAGIVSGLMAGISMALISYALADYPRPKMFGPPVLPFWAPLIMGILYGVAIHWSYYRRRFDSRRLRHTVLRTCGLCFVLKTVVTFPYVWMSEGHVNDIAGVFQLGFACMLMSLVSAVPFSFLWIMITARMDLGWSSPHWGPDKSEVSAQY